ncbi:MAG TPA: 3-hydroxyacyl-ACP dehydratase FabZ [Candidatus Saccharimonadales bacterium]|jgi:3-hydroxyacyl-[acyl-carrier-protein] dehydratase|nr:3-hydroxyacyl-ACP dehydratase FabZ [Candidatus Saccharimonadales bacterium]
MILDSVGIQKILPHRYPFLLVDTVIEIERLKRIVSLKNVSINEGYFQGHFPGKPVLPGVLIIEMMAQTGGLLLLSEIPDKEKKLFYLAAVDEARFRRPVVPGDQLRIEVTVLKWKVKFCKLQGVAIVNGDIAAEAVLRCMLVDREPDPDASDTPADTTVGVRDE